MSRVVSVDFETFYVDKSDKKEKYSVTEQGTIRYCCDPRFDPYLISVSDGAETWSGRPADFNWSALEGATLLSHNRYFDESVYEEMVKRGWAPRITTAGWHCTASLTTYLCMRRDLARAAEFLLGTIVDKSYRVDADGKNWEAIVAAGAAEKVKEAGRTDAMRCFQFWAKFGHLWPERERKLSDLTIRQGRRGIQIDRDRLAKYILITQRAIIQGEAALPWMKTGGKPTSTKALAEECRKVGIPCAPVKKHEGEEAFAAWAAQYGVKYPWVRAYADFRRINKLLANLETIKERLDGSAIFPMDFYYFGGHTGRWSGAGGFNMQNMRKEPYYFDTDGRMIMDSARLDEVSKIVSEFENRDPSWTAIRLHECGHLPSFVADVVDIRALFIARPGKKMIISDLSQIEPRVLAWIVGDRTMLASMAAGQSPYEAHARATMNWTGGDLKKQDKEVYALAKARVLSLGFGCGWEKAITAAMTMAGLDITKDDPEFVQAVNDDGEPCTKADGSPIMISGYGYNARKMVKDYREQNPLITGLWKTLDNAFKESCGGDFTMQLPSGRELRYPEVRKERKARPDPENPKKWSHRTEITALAFDQKRNAVVRTPFYGGKLTENLVQATARDIFGEHLIDLDETSGIDVLFGVHDESVNEVDQDISPKDVEHIMSRTPDWIQGCPVTAEAKEAPHYLK